MQPEICDICGSAEVKTIKCKVICQNCGTILKSCADLIADCGRRTNCTVSAD